MVHQQVEVNITGLMVVITRVTLIRVLRMAKESYIRNPSKMTINGFIMMEVLKKISAKVMEKLNGRMVVNTKAILIMMREVAKVK